MGNIHDYSEPLHLLQKFNSKRCEPVDGVRFQRKFLSFIWMSKPVFIIPGQREHAHPKPVKIAQESQVFLAHTALLNCK